MSLADHLHPASFAALPALLHQSVAPTPVRDPALAAFNPELAAELGLPPAVADHPDTLALLAGNAVPEHLTPLATAYAGHQFGTWVPQLGDGRAHLLGEIVDGGHRRWEVQLKGSGRTPYSRMGDGRAVLRSTIREYLASEAMHGLGIPTTRALAIVTSPLPVYRERTETAAILTRLAPTFVRFGTFEFLASRSEQDAIRQLLDTLIARHAAHLLTLPMSERYPAWFDDVVQRTAQLMADWTATGWTHGVMNTDNMSVLGLTLDYGPYAWVDGYDPAHVPNHTDHTGRYALDQQPAVGLWNAARLAEALLPLLGEPEAVAILERYRDTFTTALLARQRAKLGLATAQEDDSLLIRDLLTLMARDGADYTRTFRALSHWDPAVPTSTHALSAEFQTPDAVAPWLARYGDRLTREHSVTDARRHAMLATNPKYVLRTWVAQEVISRAEQGDHAMIDQVRRVLAAPCAEHPEWEHLAQGPSAAAAGLVLSCSS